MKGGRRMLKALLLLPALLIGLFVLYEAVGMAVNHAASVRQTKHVVERLRAELSQVEIIDSFTETGNTSGTGNHVDMLSVVIFRTEAAPETIGQALQEYDSLDEWSFWIRDMESVVRSREQYPAGFGYLEKMRVPENLEHCCLVYINKSAPFADNIEGH